MKGRKWYLGMGGTDEEEECESGFEAYCLVLHYDKFPKYLSSSRKKRKGDNEGILCTRMMGFSSREV